MKYIFLSLSLFLSGCTFSYKEEIEYKYSYKAVYHFNDGTKYTGYYKSQTYPSQENEEFKLKRRSSPLIFPGHIYVRPSSVSKLEISEIEEIK